MLDGRHKASLPAAIAMAKHPRDELHRMASCVELVGWGYGIFLCAHHWLHISPHSCRQALQQCQGGFQAGGGQNEAWEVAAG